MANSFKQRIAALDQIERILMTDTVTIAQFIVNRRKYLLRNCDSLSNGKIIGLMDCATSQLKAVAKLLNIIKINNKKEINQAKYLNGLAIGNIDEIATKLHRFSHNQASNPSIFLWEFALFSLISPNVIITPKYPNKLSSYPTIWRCKNKLNINIVSKNNNNDVGIFYCYAKLMPLNANMPTFNICTSPFVIGRRWNVNDRKVWPASIRSAISAKHATINHNFSLNLTNIQRNSKVNDMTINDKEPVLAINQSAEIQNNDKIEIVTNVVYEFKLIQQKPWRQNVPHFLRPTNKKNKNNNNINQFAKHRNSTPPPSVHRRQRRKSSDSNKISAAPPPPRPCQQRIAYNHRHHSPPIKKSHFNHRLNYSTDYIDLTQNDNGLMISHLPINRRRNTDNHNHHIAASQSPPLQSITATQQIYDTPNARKRKQRSTDYIPETNLRYQPSAKRARNENDSNILRTAPKMRDSYDLAHIHCIPWTSHRLLVFARYCLNPQIKHLTDAIITAKQLPDGALLHIRKKMVGSGLVFDKRIGSLLTRYGHIHSFLESILILHGGKCNLNVEYLALKPGINGIINNSNDALNGIICNEIKIGNMASGYCIMLIFVVNDTQNCVSRLLVKLEELDIDLCGDGINMKYVYGIITDGRSKWNVIRRRNKRRHIAKDVLNDPLLTNNKHFEVEKILNEHNPSNKDKFNQICASLAQERWQLFKSRHGECVALRENALYDGFVLECNISKSVNKLQEISRVIHGLIYEQRTEFRQSFEIALQHNSQLNRPAINPYHNLNKHQQKKQCAQYLSLCDKVYNVRDDFQQSLTQNDC